MGDRSFRLGDHGRYPPCLMPDLNPYSPPAKNHDVDVPATFTRLTVSLTCLAGGIAFFGLLVRYGYPSRTGPVWYFLLAPSLALLALFFSQFAFSTRTNSLPLKRGLPLLICVVSIAGYAMVTIPFAESPMIYFDLVRHLGVMGIGTILIIGTTILAHGSTSGFKCLILAVSLAILFGTTALGDLLSFVLAAKPNGG